MKKSLLALTLAALPALSIPKFKPQFKHIPSSISGSLNRHSGVAAARRCAKKHRKAKR